MFNWNLLAYIYKQNIIKYNSDYKRLLPQSEIETYKEHKIVKNLGPFFESSS